MKWVSHEVVTGMAVYTLTGALVPTACAMAGAVLPDWIEGKGGGVPVESVTPPAGSPRTALRPRRAGSARRTERG